MAATRRIDASHAVHQCSKPWATGSCTGWRAKLTVLAWSASVFCCLAAGGAAVMVAILAARKFLLHTAPPTRNPLNSNMSFARSHQSGCIQEPQTPRAVRSAGGPHVESCTLHGRGPWQAGVVMGADIATVPHAPHCLFTSHVPTTDICHTVWHDLDDACAQFECCHRGDRGRWVQYPTHLRTCHPLPLHQPPDPDTRPTRRMHKPWARLHTFWFQYRCHTVPCSARNHHPPILLQHENHPHILQLWCTSYILIAREALPRRRSARSMVCISLALLLQGRVAAEQDETVESLGRAAITHRRRAHVVCGRKGVLQVHPPRDKRHPSRERAQCLEFPGSPPCPNSLVSPLLRLVPVVRLQGHQTSHSMSPPLPHTAHHVLRGSPGM